MPRPACTATAVAGKVLSGVDVASTIKSIEGFNTAWDDGSAASGLTWAQHIHQGLTGANLNAFLYWSGSTTPSENGDNEGLLEINGSSVIPTGRLWAFANYSRYIHPGAVRIGAASSNSDPDILPLRPRGGRGPG